MHYVSIQYASIDYLYSGAGSLGDRRALPCGLAAVTWGPEVFLSDPARIQNNRHRDGSGLCSTADSEATDAAETESNGVL